MPVVVDVKDCGVNLTVVNTNAARRALLLSFPRDVAAALTAIQEVPDVDTARNSLGGNFLSFLSFVAAVSPCCTSTDHHTSTRVDIS